MMSSEKCGIPSGRRRNAGFTLVEVLVASALGATAVALAMSTFLSLSYAASGSIACAEMNRNLRHAVDTISRDLLSARNIISYSPSYYVYYVRKTPAGDAYNFFYKSGDRLMRWENGDYREVATGIDSVSFTLYDHNGAVTTTPGSARSVAFTLRSDTTVVSHEYDEEMSNHVMMRNRLQ